MRERERESNYIFFGGENVRGNDKFIENKMRRRRVKIKDIVMTHKHQIIQVMLCNRITKYSYAIFIMQ